jgi:hypothetical protein
MADSLPEMIKPGSLPRRARSFSAPTAVPGFLTPETLTEGHYYFTVMGTPLPRPALGLPVRGPPPGHQLLRPGRPGRDDADVHGSEPTSETYKGEQITTFKTETVAGLMLLRSLTDRQRAKLISTTEKKSGVNMKAGADNLELPYQGLPGSELDDAQQQNLLALVRV